MHQDKLSLELLSLERKLKIVLNEYNSQKEEIKLLRNENEGLKSILRSKDEQINSFQNKIKISKIAESMVVGDENATELKNKIDDYIKEIDKCIAHLSENF